MRPLELNVASRPFRNNTPIWTAQGILLAGVIGFSAWNAHTAVTATRKLNALQADLGSVERQLADLDRREDEAVKGIRVFDPKTLQFQADKANDIILRRGLSWTQLFNTLEKVVPYEVRMTAVRPIYGTRQAASGGSKDGLFEGTVPVDVEGKAQSFEAFLEFERALIVDPHFAGVEPIRNEQPQGSSEVTFQLRFLYDPDGRLSGEHPTIPHVLDAARKAAEEGGEAPPSALEGLR
jgi:Tfp pilus assembly protein PilN